MAIRFRFATRADAEKCNDFGNRYRHENRDLRVWEWEFARGGNLCPFVIAEDGIQIVGTQAALLTPLTFKGRGVPSAKSEETLIHPDYRGQGLFEGMYGLLLPRLESDGVEVIWGFTPARKPFERIGFKVPIETQQIVFPLSDAGTRDLIEQALGRHASRFPARSLAGLSSLALTATRRIGRVVKGDSELSFVGAWTDEHHIFVDRMMQNLGILSIDRTVEFMEWRILGNPHVRPEILEARSKETGSLVGVAVVSSHDSNAYLVDMVYSPLSREIAADMLAAVVDWAQARGAKVLRAWGQGEDPISSSLRRFSKVCGGFNVHRGFPMVVKPLSAGLDNPTGDQWYTSRLFTEGKLG